MTDYLSKEHIDVAVAKYRKELDEATKASQIRQGGAATDRTAGESIGRRFVVYAHPSVELLEAWRIALWPEGEGIGASVSESNLSTFIEGRLAEEPAATFLRQHCDPTKLSSAFREGFFWGAVQQWAEIRHTITDPGEPPQAAILDNRASWIVNELDASNRRDQANP